MRLNRFLSIPIVLLSIAGCDGPGPHFRHLDATRVTIEGATFDVRVNRRLAEAIRVNPQYAPRLGQVAGQAAQAMRLVSGCPVAQVRGDAAQVTGILDCKGRALPDVLVVGLNYECYAVGRYVSPAAYQPYVDYECEAVPY